MKYAFFVFLFILSFSSSIHARTISSFNDSPALQTIAQFMADNGEDMVISNRLSDKKLTVKDTSACVVVNSSEVMSVVLSAIKGVLRLYPDEELPIDEALDDLQSYVGYGSLIKCSLEQQNAHKKISVLYYFDLSHKIHIKVDTITLLPQ